MTERIIKCPMCNTTVTDNIERKVLPDHQQETVCSSCGWNGWRYKTKLEGLEGKWQGKYSM